MELAQEFVHLRALVLYVDVEHSGYTTITFNLYAVDQQISYSSGLTN
jgi:hypothetical protein